MDREEPRFPGRDTEPAVGCIVLEDAERLAD
jgi:hypothetical protein